MTNKKAQQAQSLFDTFLKEYLENVKTMLPQSYRARQIKMGGTWAEAVYAFEAQFLAEPFVNALLKFKKLLIENGTVKEI